MSGKEKTNGSLAMAPRVITIPAASQENTRKLRVAAYARVSSNSEDQKHSFAAQNAYFSKLITDNPDWELADIYADQGITGTSIDKREDFQRMMEDCRGGKIDRILVKSSSRFARNAKESLEAVRELAALGVSVYFEEQNIDTAQVSGEVLIAMFAALAQRESEAISERMRWSYRVRMQSGKFIPSSTAYGYRLNENQTEIVPEEAEIIRKIFADYLAGKGIQSIADDLNRLNKIESSGVPTTEDIRQRRLELDKLLQTPPVDEEIVRQKAMELAVLTLMSVEMEEYEAHRLRSIFEKQAKMRELDANLLRQSVRKITYGSKTVKVLLKNNQVLEECDDA